jgi:hypothetical protein
VKSESIAERNDQLRKRIPSIFRPDMLVLTRGVANLSIEDVVEILQKVKKFNEFTKDNDPWGEHDFGSFEYKARKFFWKIDDYKGVEGYQLILTIMFAEEY